MMMIRHTLTIILALYLIGCSHQGDEQLFADIEAGNIDAVEAAVNSGAGSNARDALGRPPLMVAIVSGNPDVVDIILQGVGDANVKFQDIPLISIAATQIPCNARIIRALAERGANINAVDEVTGSTIVMSAAALGNEACVHELVRLGTNTAVLNKRGEGLIASATLSGDASFVAEILSVTTNFDSSSSDARLALSYATTAQNKQIMKLLLGRGVQLQKSKQSGTDHD